MKPFFKEPDEKKAKPPNFESFFDSICVEKFDFSDHYKEEAKKCKEMGITWENLNPEDEYRKRWMFPNEFGISVVRGFGTYGSEKKLFECAVFFKDRLCYNSPLGEPTGYLTEKKVLAMGKKIAKLDLWDFL